MKTLEFIKNMNVQKDECYTTEAEASKLVSFLLDQNVISLNTKIWLPFDTIYSRVYLAFKHKGFKNIIRTSLAEGKDFYFYEPNDYEIIISNPPFSKRTKLFNRLFNLGKPFVVLQATQLFNNQFVVKHLCENTDIFFLMPRTRMNFMTYDKEKNIVRTSKGVAAYYSFWLTKGLFKNKRSPFLYMPDNGREKEYEALKMDGNPVEDSYVNLFNWEEKK